MRILQKVDSELLYRVQVANADDTVCCIVWLNDFWHTKSQFLELLDQGELLAVYDFIGAVGVRISQSKLYDLAQYGWVEYISQVQRANIMMNDTRREIRVEHLHKNGYLGGGIGVAIIDTGCAPHFDLVLGKNRIKKFVNILDNRDTLFDDNGHGTFVTGVLAGNGLNSGGVYSGIAPLCDVIVIKALDQKGETQAFNVLSAMQWVHEHWREYNIRVLCMSFGSTPLAKNDPLITGAKVLWDDGIVVVCAAGNDGPMERSIKAPGACASVITVGAVQKTDKGYEMAPFSSRGPIYGQTKPDIVAPGVDITSLSSGIDFYTQMSGTSVSTPIVAGVVALLLCRNRSLTPNQVKTILLHSTIHLPYPRNDCGMGMVDASKAFKF